ncbi:polynucleotide 5'-hydroxyl-kinase NOL9-like [Diorhabda sublineata]|uniref:polynucleotide 5'-hydroxyl-kinase NOL9-like n=1 Tax=Diorhabda sublineata TaxID=1163346 RepID=UPI0024E059C5|nr:polynucleotide 5'-hydroxyl-kinase NOL9-like [Diorhabda sublineata]
MNENYLDSVRQSLYDRKNYRKDSNEEELQIKSKTKRIQYGGHFLKGKSKKNVKLNNTESEDLFEVSDKHGAKKKKKARKNTIVDFNLSPSTSENSVVFKKKIKIGSKKRRKASKTELDSDESFDFNTYCSSREHSFNESLIEPHSGIDYEFPKSSKTRGKIKSKKINEKKNAKKFEKIIKSTKLIKKTSNKKKDSTDFCIENDNGACTSNSMLLNEPIEIVESPEMIQNEVQETPKVNFLCCDSEEEKIVLLEENHSIACYGFCLLKVLHGNLEILGYNLPKNREIPLFSPRGSSLLVITNITDEKSNDTIENIEKTLEKLNYLKDMQIKETTAVFLCTKVKYYDIEFIENHISQQIFPKVDNLISPRIIFDPEEQFNVININPDWANIVDSVTTLTKLLIIGGKGVGKSTFLRYTINKLLTRFDRINIVDLDPGQSEFNLPGCISIVNITEPVLGPNYTHLQRPERSYLSNINIGHNPKKYIKCIKLLMENVVQDAPIVINYMGFVHGIGINIVSSAITFIRPTDVVQIDSVSGKKNFITDINPRSVEAHCGLFGGDSAGLDFKTFKINSSSDGISGWSLEPRQVRDMCVLSYFGKLINQQTDCLTSENVPVFKISLSNIKIVDDQGNEIPAAAVNANLVALSTQIENNEFFEIVGHGIVKGIDNKTKILYLITPETFHVLKNVFYLVLTSVYLPPSVYMTHKDINGCIPYVMDGEYESLGRITKRSYIPINKK